MTKEIICDSSRHIDGIVVGITSYMVPCKSTEYLATRPYPDNSHLFCPVRSKTISTHSVFWDNEPASESAIILILQSSLDELQITSSFSYLTGSQCIFTIGGVYYIDDAVCSTRRDKTNAKGAK
jgi:hypothetical protein